MWAITRTIDWPTVGLISLLYLAFGMVTWTAPDLPWYLLLPAGGVLVCLHGSLQHECLHGHPTRWPWLNELLVFPALGLWMPYRRYRSLHLSHHRNDLLTDPIEDPESFYLTPEAWVAAERPRRWLLTANNALAGRLLIGPVLAVVAYYRSELRLIRRGDFSPVIPWVLHLPAVALLLWWVLGICALDIWTYILCFAYPGLSLTLLRSYAEHRAHQDPQARTIIVEAAPLFGLLYLNNNLHVVHHAEPGKRWYDLPALYRERRRHWIEINDGYLYRGYGDLLRRHFWTPKEPVIHPLTR